MKNRRGGPRGTSIVGGCLQPCTACGEVWETRPSASPLRSCRKTLSWCSCEPVFSAVSRAVVAVGPEVCGSIGPGMVVLLGVARGDTETDAEKLAEKIGGLRIFEDGEGKMNRSLAEVGGAMLIVSQFTLLGDCRHGRRPDFTAAAPPELAEKLYNVFVHAVAARGVTIATGRFRQQMQVELVNDGPVTLVVES